MASRPPCDEGVLRAAEAQAVVSPSVRPWVLAVAILGSSLIFIDGTVVNVALPVLQTALGASMLEAQWVVEAYALFLSALLLLGGALGDRLGHRRMFAVGMVLFAAASTGCGMSNGIWSLIAARALQGIGGALLTPGSLALISTSFPEHERGRAIGTWSGASGIAAAGGPILGGWLIDHVSWRWVFFLNLPLAAAALVALYARVPESRDPHPEGPIDWPGALLATLGLGALVYGLIESSRLGLGAPSIVLSLTGGVVLLGAFVLVEARRPAPMVPLALFRSRLFAGANLLTLLLYGALGAALFFLPFHLIQIQGYSATAAGAAFVPFVVIVFLLSRWSGTLVDRYGPRGPLVIGPTIAALGLALLARPGLGGSYFVTVFPGVVVLGLGMAVTIAPLTTTVMNAVEARRAGLASGINNAISRTAGLVAIALFSVILLRTFSARLEGELEKLSLPPALHQAITAQTVQLAAIRVPAGTPPPLRGAIEGAVARAFLTGYRVVILLAAALALASAITSALIVTASRAPSPGSPRRSLRRWLRPRRA